MALVNCPECKKEISDLAKTCPNCGYQLKPELLNWEGVIESVKEKQFDFSVRYPALIKCTCRAQKGLILIIKDPEAAEVVVADIGKSNNQFDQVISATKIGKYVLEIHNAWVFDEISCQVNITKILEIDHNASTHFNTAQGYALKGEYEKALDDCNQALKLDSRFPDLYVMRGYVYAHMGDHVKAIADLVKALEVAPENWTEREQAGRILSQCKLGKLAQFKPELLNWEGVIEKVKVKQFDFSVRYPALIRCLCIAQKGIVLIIKDPEAAVLVNSDIGKSNNQFDQVISAIKIGKYVLEIHNQWVFDNVSCQVNVTKFLEVDSNAVTYFNRGHSCLLKNEYEKALDDYNQALKLDPKFPDLYAERSSIWFHKGDLASAIADLEKALEVAPENWYPREQVKYSLSQCKSGKLAQYPRKVMEKEELMKRQCPDCQKEIPKDATRCPLCNTPLIGIVKELEGVQKIIFACKCGVKIGANRIDIGKKKTCPKCGTTLTIPDVETVTAPEEEIITARIVEDSQDSNEYVQKPQISVTQARPAPPSPELQLPKDKLKDLVRKSFAGVSDKRLFCWPTKIPEKKLNNAISSYIPLSEGEEVIAFVDTTVFGSAKEGVAITTKGVYWKDLWERPQGLLFSDIQTVEIKKRVILNGSTEIKVTSLPSSVSKGLYEFLDTIISGKLI